MDDEDLRHSEMMGVLGMEDDIRAWVVGYVRERLVCDGGCFRMDCRHSIVISHKMKEPFKSTSVSSSRSEEKRLKREPFRARAITAPCRECAQS